MNTKTALATLFVGIALLSARNTLPTTEIEPVSEPELVPYTQVADTETDLSNFYPTTGVIVDLEYDNDLVVWQDFSGNVWDFKGIEDFAIGDRIALIMNTNGTPIIYDDECVKVKYCGWEY